MDTFRFLKKRVLGLPPCVLAMAVFLLLLIGLVGVILLGSLNSSVLMLILIPIVLAASVYGRTLTLAMTGASTLTAIWLARCISPSFEASLWTIGLSTLAAVVLTESVRAVVRYRERTEAALARERDFAESLLTAAPMMVFVLDRDNRIVRMNRFAEQATGYTADDARGVDWIEDRVPPDLQETVRNFLHDAFVDPSAIKQGRVLPFRTGDGSRRDVEWHVRVIPDLLDGEPAVLAMGRDVTAQRRATRALRTSERRYRTLVENLGEGIGIVDPDETFTFANPAAERIFGVPPGTLVGRNVRDFTDNEEFAKARRGTEARAVGKTDRYELTIGRPDGEVRHLLLNAVPNLSDEGEFLGSMGIFMDITARREAENALRDFNAALEAKVGARTAELRAERARLEAILNSAADGLIVVDEEGRITQANPVAARWLAEVLSPTGADTLRETVRSMVEQAADHPERTLTLGELDLRLQAAPIEDGDDDATAVVSIQDVTALKEVNRIKSRFIEDVSHELRTPTATIKLYADMLSRAPEARRQTYQAALIAEADQLTQLVEDILRLNSIASGDWRSNARPWSLSEIVRQHEGQCQRVVETHDLHFETDLDPDAPEVQIDVTWLVDALCRLVSNAVRYTPPGGQVTIRTGTDTMNERRWATLSVVDTGVGIPEEELPHIFERFYRGDYARDQQISGTGLGLAIVKGVADLHNGRVTVESKVAEGSTFTLWFPMDRPLN